MLVEKGFWVAIILLFATSAAAIDFQYTLTQHLSGEIGSKYCPVNKDKDYLTMDETYATVELVSLLIQAASGMPPVLTGIFGGGVHWHYEYKISNFFYVDDSQEIFTLPYEYPIRAYSGNAHFGKNDHFVLSGIGIYDSSEKLVNFAYGYDPNGKESRNRWIESNTITGIGKTVRACAGCGRDGCDTSPGAYHIFLDSKPRKDSVIRSEKKKLIGTVTDIAAPQYYSNAQILFDTTAPVIIEAEDTDIRACTDTDRDKTCDYIQAEACDKQGGDWNALFYGGPQSLCCGMPPKDPAVCAYYSDIRAICGKDPEGKMKWVAAPGQARQLSCPGTAAFLSGPSNTIYSCGNTAGATALAGNTFAPFTKIKVNENEFICIPSKAEIYECTGNKTTEIEGNLYKMEGEWITDDNNKIQFCAPIGNIWTTDLDKNNGACLAASTKMPKTWPDIEWTGTKCCGEPDAGTSGATYEDPWTKGQQGKAGGCYNNTFIASGKFVDIEETTINYLGSFYKCNPQLGEGETGSTTLPGTTLSIKSRGECGTPLLNATFAGNERNIICTPDGQWTLTSSTARTKAMKTAWSESQGCCEEKQCWDGSECWKEGEYTTVDEQGYRCEKEEWKQVEMKYSWDRLSSGFCKEAGQCLIQKRFNESLDNKPDKYWSGRLDSERPKCIQTGQYISDNYCESGIWSSRTKLIAEQLIAIAGNNDYSLYCDRYENALNNYAYRTDYGLASGFLGRLCTQSTTTQRTENCVNSICVMKYGNNIAFGTAINTDISGEKSPLQALNMARDECDEAKKTGGYNACGKNSIWYNHDTQSIIYAPGITRMPEPESTAVIEPYNELKEYVRDNVYDPEVSMRNYSFFNVTPQFKFLYVAKNRDKTAYSFKQENISDKSYPTDYAGWIYENIELPEDACDRYIKKYDSKANCETQSEETKFYIAAYRKQNPADKRASIIDAWPDTTGKLRINPG